jgi:hypothetical protein
VKSARRRSTLKTTFTQQHKKIFASVRFFSKFVGAFIFFIFIILKKLAMKKILLSLLLLWVTAFANAQINPDSITFETSIPSGMIRIESGSLWQIGSPHKTFFNSAHHGTEAIVTDTLNSYPPNDTSRFILTLYPPYISTCGTVLTFSHKYDMDTLGDMGIIEASYDGGNSWLTLKDTMHSPGGWTTFFFNWNWDYHETSGMVNPHDTIINGKSDGWIQSGFYWRWWIPVKSDTIIINPDSLMLRFTFISDSIIKNKEGWMIDDLSLWYETLCSGIAENSTDGSVSLFPNPTEGIINLSFSEAVEATEVEVLNSFGQVIMRKDMNFQPSNRLDLSGQAKGLYFIRLQTGSGVEVRKVILE